MTAVLFTSDLHFGHRKVAETRGFASVEEHDDHLRHQWASTVNPGDLVYVLGDIAVSSPVHALRCLAGLPGRKRLVWGNHDKGHPMHRDAWNHQAIYLRVFEGVAQSARIRLQGQEAVLSHFPYERDREETRYAQWRLRDEGLPLLHGHTHGTERLVVKDVGKGQYAELRTEVHVGLDAWGLRPVPDAEIAALLAPVLS